MFLAILMGTSVFAGHGGGQGLQQPPCPLFGPRNKKVTVFQRIHLRVFNCHLFVLLHWCLFGIGLGRGLPDLVQDVTPCPKHGLPRTAQRGLFHRLECPSNRDFFALDGS